MASIEVKISMELGLSAQLEKLVDEIVSGAKFKVEPADEVKELPTNVDKQQKQPAKSVAKSQIAEQLKADVMAEDKQKAEEPKAEPSKPAETLKPAERIRAAIHETRKRIEGEDYETNASGELRKKYHHKLTDQFHQLSRHIGNTEKPSELTGDQVDAFVEQCSELIIDEAGDINVKAPF
jgi:hypothetical protein